MKNGAKTKKTGSRKSEKEMSSIVSVVREPFLWRHIQSAAFGGLLHVTPQKLFPDYTHYTT